MQPPGRAETVQPGKFETNRGRFETGWRASPIPAGHLPLYSQDNDGNIGAAGKRFLQGRRDRYCPWVKICGNRSMKKSAK
jgi:hypothetical protein